jgi:hypothetical protein
MPANPKALHRASGPHALIDAPRITGTRPLPPLLVALRRSTPAAGDSVSALVRALAPLRPLEVRSPLMAEPPPVARPEISESASASPSATPPSPNAALVANALRLDVGELMLLLRRHDFDLVSQIYAGGAADVATRREFFRFVRRFEPTADLRGPPVVTALDRDAATIEFPVQFRWRSHVGVTRSRLATFTGLAMRRGQTWRLERVESVSPFWK